MKWTSVKDRLPENSNEVLVFAPNCDIIGSILIGKYFNEDNAEDSAWTVYDFEESTFFELVTHWMPLPEPPTGEK